MNLNIQQKKAVEYEGGPLLVLAGAGSGKTRVLTSRIVHLIKNKGVNPFQILAVTFTNKAAGQMKLRVEKMIDPNANSLWIGTFHSICAKILRRHAEKIGLTDQFAIYDEPDQISVLKGVLNELNISEKLISPSSAVDKISRAKDSLIIPKDYPDGDFYNSKVAKVYARYQELLQSQGAVDFGDLIMRVVELFKIAPDILTHYQDRFHHVLVDEYQDTNHAQYQLVYLLADKYKNIFVVGDPDQSIYKWRGADISNILEFERDFTGAHIIKLEQNYRSTKNILSASDAVIANNRSRRPKELWTENDDGEKVTIIEAKNERGEAKAITQEIKRLSSEGKPLNEMAIFYRTNAQSRIFEEELRRESIPYTIYGGIKFYNRSEIKDIISYLRLIQNPKDNVSLKRIINAPTRGIGKTTIERLEKLAANSNISIYDFITTRIIMTDFNEGTKRRLISFTNIIKGLSSSAEKPLPEFITEVVEKTGYITSLKTESTDEAIERIENIDELISAVSEGYEQTPKIGLSDFLEQVALVTEIDRYDENQLVLPLMTLHLSKGLEFPCVFIVGLEEGLLPHIRSMDDEDELEEERRLFYVGMTRAKEKLYLAHSSERLIRGDYSYNVPSRFLEEVPENYIERLPLLENSLLSHKNFLTDDNADVDYDFSQLSDDELKPKGFRSGQRVRHPTFGEGIIRKAEGAAGEQRLIIQFNNGELKRLSSKYANLTPV